jgi:xanthine dehydrogenase accessory factor
MKKEVFLKVDELLGAGKRVVLAVIIRRAGSAPRGVGTQCMILEDGSLLGTIGGGLLEHRVLEKAGDVFRQGASVVLPLFLSSKDVAASEMICGGNVEVYLDPLFPENRDTVALFRAIREMIESGRQGTLLSRIADGIPALDLKNKQLMEEGTAATGEIDGLTDEAERLSRFARPRLVEISELGMSVFVEPVEDDPVLYLFGAGHVSTFVAPLAKMVGFRVVVMDDRPEFANEERFPEADEIHIVEFPKAFEQITVTGSSYLAIMTRGHTHDRIVLEAALRTEPAYIGMISSRKKWALIREALLEAGVPAEKIDQVHSPIGVHIGGETPEEIAVSIVAELIQTRSAKSG